MKRKLWWRMEQNATHNARESWLVSCSVLLHNFRSLSHSPESSWFYSEWRLCWTVSRIGVCLYLLSEIQCRSFWPTKVSVGILQLMQLNKRIRVKRTSKFSGSVSKCRNLGRFSANFVYWNTEVQSRGHKNFESWTSWEKYGWILLAIWNFFPGRSKQ